MGWAGLKKKKKKRCSRINWSSYCIECSLLGQYPDHGHLYPVDPGEDLQLAPTHTETPQMKESNIIIQPLVESDNTSVNACKGHLTLRIYCSYRTTVCALTMRFYAAVYAPSGGEARQKLGNPTDVFSVSTYFRHICILAGSQIKPAETRLRRVCVCIT